MNKQKNMIYTGDSLVIIKSLTNDSVDAVVTDPPYGISLNNHKWDQDVPAIELWKEVFRVLKPGGHLLAFAGSRTYHRMATNIEQAGFEIRDQIMWIYATGFPRSFNITLAIERKHGPTVAQNWQGLGTTLKPAHEPIVVARKPFPGPVIDNVLTFGTGGLNIEKSKIQHNEKRTRSKLICPLSWYQLRS